MKRVYDLSVYEPLKVLSDMVWYDYDECYKSWRTQPKIERVYQQYKTMKAIFLISAFRERLSVSFLQFDSYWISSWSGIHKTDKNRSKA